VFPQNFGNKLSDYMASRFRRLREDGTSPSFLFILSRVYAGTDLKNGAWKLRTQGRAVCLKICQW
jgi:hypothetical protein